MTHTQFSPTKLCHHSPLPNIIDFAERAGISYSLDPSDLKQMGSDFGHLQFGSPLCILKPKNTNELTAIVQEANLKHYALTPRGRGLSQSGQSISSRGISLEMSHFSDIAIDGSNQLQARCGAGVTWRQLMMHCSNMGYLPYVMPLNLDLTIAGTLSAGGFGATSYRFGPAIAHVEELEVVTGKGEWVICNANHRSEVFHSVLGGIGRSGVIASATLRLRSFKPKVRTYYLLYSDLEQYLGDQQWLSTQDWTHYVEGFCSSSVQGLRVTPEGRRPFFHWQYGLHLGIEFESKSVEALPTFLSQLHHQQLLLVEDADTIEFLSRYDARFQQMRHSKEWEKAHPWFECLLPLDVAKELIPQFLKELPSFFADGHRIMYLPKTDVSPIFKQPDSSSIVVFAVLPKGICSTNLSDALEVLEKLNVKLVGSGGKRYLSGWLGSMKNQNWQQHFDNQYEYWRLLKTTLDPNHVLQSVLFGSE